MTYIFQNRQLQNNFAIKLSGYKYIIRFCLINRFKVISKGKLLLKILRSTPALNILYSHTAFICMHRQADRIF